jgi:hypothetical protein
MFDTVRGKFEKGPYFPKDESRISWETKTREFFDTKLNAHLTKTSYVLNRPQARILIYGDRGGLQIEASLPKLLYGNNLMAVCDSELPLTRLREFVADHVNGEIPDLAEMEFLRVDYCHNFRVGSALPDYVHTLSEVSFLKHRRTTDGYGGVEWWTNNNSRRIRAYDKHKEILEKDKKAIAEARGILRFEIQLRKTSRYLQRRQKKETLTLQDVLKPEIAYCCLVETLEKMCCGLRFQTQDAARQILDENFSFRKSTRLLGVLRRLQTESMDDVRRACGRSTFYADKKELKRLGFWPPSSSPLELPGLQLPPLEELLSHHTAFADGLDSSAQAEKAA